MCLQANSSLSHQHDPGRNFQVVLLDIFYRILLECIHLIFTNKPESLSLEPRFKLLFAFDKPPICESDGTVISAESHRNRISILLLVGANSIQRVFIAFGVEWIDKLSNFVHYFLRSLFEVGNLLACLFSQSLFYWSDCPHEICYLLHFCW